MEKVTHEEAMRLIDRVKEMSAKFKHAYFWTGDNGNEAKRKAYEKRYSVPEFQWEEDDHVYAAEFVVSQSRKCTYAHVNCTKDGQKTTMTSINHSYTRMQKESTNGQTEEAN